MSGTIQGILFDLGETLLHFGQVKVNLVFTEGARMAYDYLKQLGQPLPPFAIYRRKQSWAIRWHEAKARLTGREFNSLELLAATSRKLDQRLSHEQVVEMARMFYEPLRRHAIVEDGVAQMLARFQSDGLSLGVVSNTFLPSEVLDSHLQQEGLLEFLPTRVYSCEVGFRKPHPKIFSEAIRQADLDPARTLFVGDMLRPDVLGANRAGMISVLKDPTNLHVGSRITPRHRIRGLLELPQIVDRYNNSNNG